MSRRALVTGAMGCLGAWTVKHLLEAGHVPVAFDLATDRRRLEALMSADELAGVTFERGDLTDGAGVRAVMEKHAVEHIVHLAALQVPFCRADPPLGARVNVEGTVHVFEAARVLGIGHLAFASSIAVYGPASDYPAGLVDDTAPKRPRTFYGVTKIANEGTARVYWLDHGVSSVALRPYTVYGVGRDQGVTSEPSVAMAAAARGEDARISFGGKMQLQWASDVAQQFLDAALVPRTGEAAGGAANGASGVPRRSPERGAHVFDLGGPVVDIEEVARIIERVRPDVRITVGDARLPFPDGFDDTALRAAAPRVYETSLEEGVRRTIERFEALASR